MYISQKSSGDGMNVCTYAYRYQYRVSVTLQVLFHEYMNRHLGVFISSNE